MGGRRDIDNERYDGETTKLHKCRWLGVDEIMSHPAWPELADEAPELVEVVSNVGLDISSLLFDVNPCSLIAADQAALADIHESMDWMLLALDDVLARHESLAACDAQVDQGRNSHLHGRRSGRPRGQRPRPTRLTHE